MHSLQTYNQFGLSRLASVLLRQNHPATAEEGRAALRSSLGVYAPDVQALERAINDYFRPR
jgi:hypothetical protein